MMVRNGWVYWPLEAELTEAAMHHVEAAIRDYLKYETAGEAAAELYTLANTVRACLQHVEAEKRAAPATLEDFLS